MKKNLIKFAIINLYIGLFLIVLTYCFYHFVPDAGRGLVFQSEPGKPFGSNLLGFFSVLFVWSSVTCFLASAVFFKKDK